MPRKQEVWYYAVVDNEKRGPLLHAFDTSSGRDAFILKNRAAGATVEAVGVRRALKIKRRAGEAIEIRHRTAPARAGIAQQGADGRDGKKQGGAGSPDAKR